MTDVVSAVQSGIEAQCQCGFTSEFITDSGFMCQEGLDNYATFRATMYSLVDVNVSRLLSYVNSWRLSIPSILVQGLFLSVEESCPVAIATFQDEQCRGKPDEEEESEKDNLTAPVVGSAIAVAVILAIVALIVVCTVVVMRRRKRGKATITQ